MCLVTEARREGAEVERGKAARDMQRKRRDMVEVVVVDHGLGGDTTVVWEGCRGAEAGWTLS